MIGNPPSRHPALALLAMAGVALTTACSNKPRDNARSSSTAATSTATTDTVSRSSLGGTTPAESTRTDDLAPGAESRRTTASTTTRSRRAATASRTTRRTARAPVAPTSDASRTEVTVGTPRDSIPATPVNPPATPATPATPVMPPPRDSTPDDPYEPQRLPVSPATPDSTEPTPVPARDTAGRNPLDVTDERDLSPSLANDIRIARLLVVANRIDSAAAALVARTGSHADVKAFAELMVRDHGQANERLMQLVRTLDATPAVPEDTVTPQRTAVDELVGTLEAKSGAEFDRTYIDAEVRMHQDAIAKLDLELPQVQNAELKALLVQARGLMVTHLDRARQIQSAIAN